METTGHALLFNKEILALSRRQHFKACHLIPGEVFEGNNKAQPCVLTILLSPAETRHSRSQWAVLYQTEAIGH